MRLALTLVLLGACSASWQVTRRANPNPFAPQSQFVVEPIRFDQVLVNGSNEGMYLANASQKEAARWEAAKLELSARFFKGLADSGATLHVQPAGAQAVAGAYAVRIVCRSLEAGGCGGGRWVGRTMVVDCQPMQVHVDVQIVDPEGQVVDELSSGAEVMASSFNTLTGRAQTAGSRLGADLARYLRTRVAH